MTGDAERLSAPGAAGLSLQAMIGASVRLDELSTARVIGEAAEAVHKAQKAGQALGALTPAAIVVRPSGAVALELPSAGRAGYTAPERLRGSPGDRRSDVFSLGVLLWEALAHERLFSGATDEAAKAAVLAGAVRPPSSCNANVPAELDAICKKALARDPVDRYQSAKVMAAEIAAVLDDAGYPESNEQIARYVAEAPAQALSQAEAQAQALSQERSAIGRSTTLGVGPVRAADEPVLLEKKLEPAPILLDKKKLAEAAKPAKPVDAAKPEAAKAADAAKPAPLPSLTKPASPAALAAHAPASAAPPPTVSPAAPPTIAAAAPPAVAAASPAPASPAAVPFVLGPIPGGTVEPSSPSKLGVLPPGSQTMILGSIGAAAEPAPAAAPAPAAEPAAPAVAPAAPVSGPRAPLVPSAPSEVEAAQASSPAGSQPVAQSKPAAEDAPAEDAPAEDAEPATRVAPHPASVVALRSPTRGDQSTAGDMLGGWGWSADAPGAVEDEYEDHGRTSRKRLVLAIGGGAAALLLVTVLALAAGGSKDKGAVPTPAAQVAKAWDTAPPAAPATSAAAVPPEPSEPSKPEPATVEPPKPEPPAAEPPRPEPPKPEPAEPEPAKLAAKPEPARPAKPEPAKPAAKPEPAKLATKPAAKPEPAKLAAKPEPKKPAPTTVAVAARKADKPRPDASRPLDPYGEARPEPKKVDPGEAYKTGLQQFARGDSSGALATFKASLASSPGHAPTWRGIGLVYEKLGQKAQARAAFQKYLALAPSAGDADMIRERMGRLP